MNKKNVSLKMKLISLSVFRYRNNAVFVSKIRKDKEYNWYARTSSIKIALNLGWDKIIHVHAVENS